MTTVQVETSPFAMFPAQGDYSNTEAEKLHALGVLSAHADSADALREVAVMLDLIDPPTKKAAPVYCHGGHDQTEHGRTRTDGLPYCYLCARAKALTDETTSPVGTVRRLRHLLLNGFTLRELGRVLDMSAPTVGRIARGDRARLHKKVAADVREVFDTHRDEYHHTKYNDRTADARKDWVWAELYEDIDDPQSHPVFPKAAA